MRLLISLPSSSTSSNVTSPNFRNLLIFSLKSSKVKWKIHKLCPHLFVILCLLLTFFFFIIPNFEQNLFRIYVKTIIISLDLTRIIVVQLKEWRAKSSQFFSELSQQLKEMPILNIISEKVIKIKINSIILHWYPDLVYFEIQVKILL